MAALLLRTMFHYRDLSKYALHDFVIMPNHLHLILTPRGTTLERAMQLIKGGFSYRVTHELKNMIEVWQKGFTDHRLRDAEDYEKHRHYVHLNAVKAGLCASPDLYPYCSANPIHKVDPVPQRLKPLG